MSTKQIRFSIELKHLVVLERFLASSKLDRSDAINQAIGYFFENKEEAGGAAREMSILRDQIERQTKLINQLSVYIQSIAKSQGALDNNIQIIDEQLGKMKGKMGDFGDNMANNTEALQQLAQVIAIDKNLNGNRGAE